MKTIVISATREKDIQKTLLFKSIVPLTKKTDFDFFFFNENTQGLSAVYNKALVHYADYDAIVFIHDDVYLDDAFFVDKLEDGFNQYDIAGVAGCINPTLKQPVLWHLMADRPNLRGYAGHLGKDGNTMFMSSFGHTPSRVTLLDGVLMAVNVKKVTAAGWKFNENYDFHLYDLSSCLDANAKGLKCGVLPIHIIHNSPGLSNIQDPIFQKNTTQFLKEYCH